ncbi:hypothetical protein Tco_0799433 [Tanacetum coccineum]|uniref:Uncharacterized protein n=1 Tax=Tanacetum coccineum TaxID=301880 RepID=A0ABQ4ZRA6_9ASTR
MSKAKRLKIQTTSRTKMLLMQAQENESIWMKKGRCFLSADECDAFAYECERSHFTEMFMASLTSKIIYDKPGIHMTRIIHLRNCLECVVRIKIETSPKALLKQPSKRNKMRRNKIQLTPSDDISMQDEGNVSDMEDTDNAHIPKVSTTTWFKPILESERPTTPEPEWTIPPNDFPEPDHNWANAYAITYKVLEENKLQRKTCELDDECHKLTELIRLMRNLRVSEFYKNINVTTALGGPPSQVTIQPQFFFNKDLDYLLTGDKERKIALSISKLKAARYLDFGLEELVPSLCVEKYGYNYLREIILRRADYPEYKISEKDFKNLHPNDFEDLFLLNIQEKLNIDQEDKISLPHEQKWSEDDKRRSKTSSQQSEKDYRSEGLSKSRKLCLGDE